MTTTKTRPTAISDLVTLQGKASSWRSVRTDTGMDIYHYSTLMAQVENGTLVQVSQGWGSMSDKCGMSKLRSGALKAGIAI
jgi:hypothetical protein